MGSIARALFDPAQAGEVVEDLALGALRWDERGIAALERADLGERERIALERWSVRPALAVSAASRGVTRLEWWRRRFWPSDRRWTPTREQPGGDGELRAKDNGAMRQV